ncbi:uncharacterized protein LOC135291302 isoform X2 [Passer domesticus]|uniref:uncharacterized protein LOC135291302 isoform X2 n=1 Tax=Passer domesticus TaxID=48849 RepID=UPI0030FE3975
MLTSFLSTSPAPSEAAGRDAVGSRGRGRMWDARVPAEALPPGVARGRQRRRTSAAPLGPPDRPAQHRPVPRDCRPGPGTAARTHRRRGVSLTEWRRVCYPLPLCPSYRLSFRSGESTPLYLHRGKKAWNDAILTCKSRTSRDGCGSHNRGEGPWPWESLYATRGSTQPLHVG